MYDLARTVLAVLTAMFASGMLAIYALVLITKYYEKKGETR